ncbi:MAG: lipoyl(octanoyl) transferase [Bdellovibrio sp.]|nr:MAG: lipoyl(octanoyl) transferase [Bdellovibrio sp.]
MLSILFKSPWEKVMELRSDRAYNKNHFDFLEWGEIPYSEAEKQQLQLVEEVFSGQKDKVILCSHPPVVTLGRASQKHDIKGWQGEVHYVSRGGRATYHGPGQVVIYPIWNLKKERPYLRARDVHAYLRFLESLCKEGLCHLGLSPVVRETGIWVNNKKVISIGIAVRKWVTYHGVAINVKKDQGAFSGIRPCGYEPSQMTCLEDLLQKTISTEEIKNLFKTIFCQL